MKHTETECDKYTVLKELRDSQLWKMRRKRERHNSDWRGVSVELMLRLEHGR